MVLFQAKDFDAVLKLMPTLPTMSIDNRADQAKYLLNRLTELVAAGQPVDNELIQVRYQLNLVVAGAKEWQAKKRAASSQATRSTTSSLPIG